MAEQINYNKLYENLTPLEQEQYAGYKIARNLVPEERETQDRAFPEFKEILEAEAAAASTKPNMWNPMNWLFSPAASAESGIPTTNVGQQYFDYYSKYGDNYSNLKIPGSNWRQKLMNQKIQQQKKMIGMPQHLTYTPPSSPIQQVQQNIQTYGNRDRPNEGINTPGGGKGQSPTGGDVAGTPFVRGGRASYFDGGLLSLWPR